MSIFHTESMFCVTLKACVPAYTERLMHHDRGHNSINTASMPNDRKQTSARYCDGVIAAVVLNILRSHVKVTTNVACIAILFASMPILAVL